MAEKVYVPSLRISAGLNTPTSISPVKKCLLSFQSRCIEVIKQPIEVAKSLSSDRIGELAGKIWESCRTITKIVSEVWGALSKGRIPTGGETTFFHKAMTWLTKTPWIMETFKWMRLACIATAALSAISLFVHAYQCVVGTVDQKIDASLKMMTDLGGIAGSISAFCIGLADQGLVMRAAIGWLPVLNIATAALSLGTLGLSIKKYVQLSQTLNQLETKGEKAIEQYSKENPEMLKKHFSINGKKLKTALQKMMCQPASIKQIAITNLKARLLDNMFTEKLSIIAACVSFVGLGVLLISPLAPFVIVGFGLLAMAALIGTGALVYHFVTKHRFEKAMHL